MKMATATITLFHTVPLDTCGKAKVEMNSQIARSVFANRAAGANIAATAKPTQSRPTIHVLVREASACGQMNAEMNNHTPSAMFSQRLGAASTAALLPTAEFL